MSSCQSIYCVSHYPCCEGIPQCCSHCESEHSSDSSTTEYDVLPCNYQLRHTGHISPKKGIFSLAFVLKRHASETTFTKCMDTDLSPLRQKGVCILNFLDDWLILAQLETELDAHRSLLLRHLKYLGLRINITKSSLSLDFFPGSSPLFSPNTGHAHTRASLDDSTALCWLSFWPSEPSYQT